MNRQDFLIALFLALEKQNLYQKEIADRLKISRSTVSYAMNRLIKLKLINEETQQVMVHSLLDFIKYAIHLVYPTEIGSKVRGVPTALSGPILNKLIPTEDKFVWKSDKGTIIGQEIKPLYDSVPDLVKTEPALYKVLSLIDAVRTGNSREKDIANKELKTILSKTK